jgi:4-amino-4-deoxy-L-arabinose transferase-like glycosyltransferase
MPTGAAASERGLWLIPAGAAVLAITALRVWLLALNRMDLFVDEAQYWLWGRELALGYYSKPPMIGWVIRAATWLGGSDAPFWVRLPAPLFHGATALILGGIAARLWGARAALWTSLGYATLPMVVLGSILISTDTIMFPFLALALAAWLRVLGQGGRGWAMAAGLALGLAFLAKYAAIYYLICGGLAALILPAARPRGQEALILLAVFALTISPNVAWNLTHGMSTLQHTLDNAGWVRDPAGRAGLNPLPFASFLASQAAVFGPVLFGGLIWRALTLRRADGWQRLMLVFSLPILAIVSVQALLSQAYANWAATAYLAGTLAVLPWLSRRWRIASFAINGAVALALPLLGVFAPDLGDGQRSPIERYLGRAALSEAIISAAEGQGVGAVVADDRDVLADLFHTGRDAPLAFFAPPPEGRAPNHYALTHPLPAGLAEEVLFVTSGGPPDCASGAPEVAVLAPDAGAYRGKRYHLYRVPADCWARP